jgi:D-3-phosphoglycerate dehydrogenase / 2-oxoglutarate reductase
VQTIVVGGPTNDVPRPIVLVTWPDFPSGDGEAGGRLRSAGMEVLLAPKRGRRTAEEMCELAPAASAAIVSTDPFDASVIAACPRLRVIARVGVGVDSIDLGAATRAGIVVTVTPGANDVTAADHTLALMLAATRRVIEHDAAVRRGEWPRTGAHTPWELTGATVGIIGYGRIGQLVADRLAGFNARVIVSDPARQAGPPAENAALEELLSVSDIVSVHTPLTRSTRNMIGTREFTLMRPGAILINTSRGGVVDEAAMVAQLETGRLRAAALDVYETEPPRPSRLLELPNVVVTPHTAGISERSVRDMVEVATTSVLSVLRGQPEAASIVNPAALAGPSQANESAG